MCIVTYYNPYESNKKEKKKNVSYLFATILHSRNSNCFLFRNNYHLMQRNHRYTCICVIYIDIYVLITWRTRIRLRVELPICLLGWCEINAQYLASRCDKRHLRRFDFDINFKTVYLPSTRRDLIKKRKIIICSDIFQ